MPAADQFLRLIDRSRLWLLAASALLLLASFSTHWRITPDSAVFLGIARNLAEGRGFTFNEQAVASVNAGFPYLLAAAHLLTPDPIIASNALVLAFGFASLALVYLLMLRQASRPIAVLIVTLTAINGTFLRHSCEILADVPFFFFCTLALLGYEFSFARKLNPADQVRVVGEGAASRAARLSLAAALVVIGLAGMASLRIVFLGPLAAILVDLLWRIRSSRFKWAVIAAAAGVLLVALSIRLADPRMAGGFTLLSKERELLEILQNFRATASRIASFNAPQLFTDSAPRAMFGNKIGLWPVDVIVSLFVLGAGVMLVRRRLAWAVLIAIYVAQWLLIFPDSRYFLPVLPLLLLGWWDLAILLAGRVRLQRQSFVVFAMLALVAIPNLVRSIGFAIEQHHRPFLARYLRGRFQDLPDFAARLKERLPSDSVIIAGAQFAAPLHYFSGLRTIPTVGPTLLNPLPDGRAVFALLPADDGFDAAIKTHHLKPGPVMLRSADDESRNALSIIPLNGSPATGE